MSEMNENTTKLSKLICAMLDKHPAMEVQVGFCRIDGEMIDTTEYTGLGWHMLVRFQRDSTEKIIHRFLGHTMQSAIYNIERAVQSTLSEFHKWGKELQ